MKRGDLIVVSAPGVYGKPRPAVLVQSNVFPQDFSSVIVCQMTTHITDAYFRLTIEPAPENGLPERSEIMVEKPQTLRRERVGKIIGTLSAEEMAKLNSILAVVMGLAD